MIFLSRGWLPSPIALTETQEELLDRLGGTLGEATTALNRINGSFVASIIRDGHPGWIFAHPTMTEAYADRLRNPEFFHLLVEGLGTDALLEHTTCGDVGRHNPIVLPESVWPSVMDRLDEPFNMPGDIWRQRDRRRTYLAHHCAPSFQAAYIERQPQLLDNLSKPGLMLEADSDNALVVSLHQNGILPEATRAVFAGHLIDYCIDGTDGAVLWDDPLRSLLTPAEEDQLRKRLIAEVIPNPRSVVAGFVQGAEHDDPEGSTYHLEEYADALQQEFPGNPDAEAAADEVRDARWEWVYDQGWHDPDESDYEPYRSIETAGQLKPTVRSIFDDLVPDDP